MRRKINIEKLHKWRVGNQLPTLHNPRSENRKIWPLL